MFSQNLKSFPETGHHLELLRLAIPRRTYTESHFRYVAEVFSQLKESKKEIPSLHCVYRPEYLGHFSAKFELRKETELETIPQIPSDPF